MLCFSASAVCFRTPFQCGNDILGNLTDKELSHRCMVSCDETKRPLNSLSNGRRTIKTYFTGIIVCWYGVPAHMTYGIVVLGSGERG